MPAMSDSNDERDMVLFDLSLIDSTKYPFNLPKHGVSFRRLKKLARQLHDQSKDLFSDEPDLGFWDLYHGAKDFQLTRTHSLEDVRRLCSWSEPRRVRTPRGALACRFIFLHSENARSKLYTSKEMLNLALSYHLVMPWFLEFLFMFGQQFTPRDFRFSAFRHKNFEGLTAGLKLPELGRTGHETHICYNLKWPEETSTTSHRPWSMRQTVTYSIFDIGSGTAFFIILKGNESMSKDLREETKRWKWKDPNNQTTLIDSFGSYLRTHLFICESSCETWRSYINYLERRLNVLTEEAVTLKEERKPPHRVNTNELQPGKPGLRQRLYSNGLMQLFPSKAVATYFRIGSWGHQNTAEPADTEKAWEVHLRPGAEPEYIATKREIDFSKLQEATFMDEKTNEGIYALTNDIEIMTDLSEQYRGMQSLPDYLRDETFDFADQLRDMIRELEMYRSSLQNFLRTFTERKSLVAAILQNRNTQASESFALESKLASQRMEVMTKEMRELTRKTKRETLSMSVIAGVTMFFLPGTFVSTFMSTPVLTWNEQPDGTFRKHSEPGAWKFFLSLTLPLTVATFAIWFLLTWRYNSKDSAASQLAVVDLSPTADHDAQDIHSLTSSSYAK